MKQITKMTVIVCWSVGLIMPFISISPLLLGALILVLVHPEIVNIDLASDWSDAGILGCDWSV